MRLLVALLVLLVGCATSEEEEIREELEQGWSELTTQEQAIVCLNMLIVSDEVLMEDLAREIGEDLSRTEERVVIETLEELCDE